MTQIETRLAIFAAAICFGLAGCGKADDKGKNIDMGVPGTGIVLGSDTSTCQDKILAKTGTIVHSATKYAVFFRNFSLTWKDPSSSLYVTSLVITATSSNMSSDFSVTLGPDEVNALIAAADGKITVPSGSKTYTVNSNDTSRTGTAFAPCGLAFGGLSVIDPNQTFSVNVTIKLTGYSDDGANNFQNVTKTINAIANY